jgi:hypothetical protein
MSGEDDDRQAALYALGVLSGADYALAAERVTHEPAFAEAVAGWEVRLAPIGLALEPLEPPADLLDRIEARIDAATAISVQRLVIRATEGEWIDVMPGVRCKLLHQKPEIGRQTILYEMQPGTTGSIHGHDDDEEVYVVWGDIRFGDDILGPGDFHLSPKGSLHPPVYSTGGCLCLIVMPIE